MPSDVTFPYANDDGPGGHPVVMTGRRAPARAVLDGRLVPLHGPFTSYGEWFGFRHRQMAATQGDDNGE